MLMWVHGLVNRTYNGVAVQTLAADLPPAQPKTGFPNRKGHKILMPGKAWKMRLEDLQQYKPPPKVTLDGKENFVSSWIPRFNLHSTVYI